MKYKKIFDAKDHSAGKITYAIVFEKGDDVLDEFANFIQLENIGFAEYSGIGAFEDSEIGLYENGEYKKFKYPQLLEVVNFTGNITLKEGPPKIHTHTTLSYEKDGDIKTVSGHFFGAKVAVTLEIILNAYFEDGKPLKIGRKYNSASKIDTWNL